ncbi:15728_t:CDS:2, partial [Racocetra persica]
MIDNVKDKKEIVRSSINLIWEATDGEIKKIVFNNQSCSAAIFLSDDTKDTENLNTPGVVLIAKETYRKIINDLADMKGKDSVATEDDLDSDNLLQVDELMFDAQASENDTLNLEEGQHTEDNNVNNDFEETNKLLPDSYSSINITIVNNEFESNEEIDALLPDSYSSINVTANTSQAVSTDNQISIDNEYITDNQQAKNGELVESLFNNKEVDELLPDSHSPINVTINTSQAVSIDNQISPDNECVTDNQKVDFELSQAEVSIEFESKGYDLPSLDNLLKYCEKLEEFIDKLYYNGDIEAGKHYIQENDKKFTFSKNVD